MDERSYCWGSSMNLMKHAMIFAIADKICGERQFYDYAAQQLHVPQEPAHWLTCFMLMKCFHGHLTGRTSTFPKAAEFCPIFLRNARSSLTGCSKCRGRMALFTIRRQRHITQPSSCPRKILRRCMCSPFLPWQPLIMQQFALWRQEFIRNLKKNIPQSCFPLPKSQRSGL